MSYIDGRHMDPHAGHRDGKCVDIRPVRKDRLQKGVTYTDPQYDREETQRLVDAFRANNENVDRIFFNDSKIIGVHPWPGHHDHLHVHFRK
jgi:penicillin-insensitive murein endopeptidase